jgi:hypothetical protein
MKKIPLQLKIASIFSAIGGAIGALVTSFWGINLYNLLIGTLGGVIIFFIIGRQIAGMIKQTQNVARVDRFATTFEIIVIIFGWAFVVISLSALFIDGWNLNMALSTLFFFICTSYLTYRFWAAKK